MALLLLQTLSIAGLLAQRAKRQKAENAVRANEAALLETNERIHELAGRLIGAQEEARTRVARDLHDDVCQQLAGVSMGMSELRRQHGDLQTPLAQRALQSLQARTQTLIEDVRRLSHQLHPTALRHMGLPSALKAHCIEVERQHDLQVSFSGDHYLGEIPAVESLCLYRVSQEALRNAAVHADARRVGVTLRKVGEGIELLVVDDGKGFDADRARRTGGLGLISMEERVHLLGGQFRIDSQPGTGTTIRVGLPLQAGDSHREELQVVQG